MRNVIGMLCALVLGAPLSGCTDEDASRHALEAQGFSSIEFGGYAWIGCGDDDTFATEFTAKNPVGRSVSGVVCCGLWKSCTVRF